MFIALARVCLSGPATKTAAAVRARVTKALKRRSRELAYLYLSAPLWPETYAKDPALLGKVDTGALQCLLNANDGGDMALRRSFPLLDPRNGGKADFCSFGEVLLPPGEKGP